MLIPIVIIEYLRFLQYDKKIAEQTIVSQRTRLAQLSMRWIDRDIRSLTVEDVVKLKEEMIARECKNAYINTYLFSLRALLRHLREDKKMEVLDPEDIKILKVPPAEVDFLEKDEVQEILDRIPEEGIIGARDQALIRAMFNSGARVGEILSLNRWGRHSVKIDENGDGWAYIIGKGGIERIIYFTSWATEYIKRYMDMREDSEPALFVAFCNQMVKRLKRLKPEAVRRRIKTYGKHLSKRLYNHLTRKTFATTAADNGLSIEKVSKLLGHKSIVTTIKHYRGIGQKELRKEHKKYVKY